MSAISEFIKLYRENKISILLGKATTMYYASDAKFDTDEKDFEDLVSTIKLLLGESTNG